MRKFSCYDCEAEFTSDSRMDILKQLYEHYMRMHKDIITKASEEEKKAWMEQFERDWEAAGHA